MRGFFQISDKKRCLLTHTKAKKRAIFSGFRSKKGDILEKSRAARAMKATDDHENQDLTLDIGKSEDPAKTTHSIPDLMSRT